jgi:preprotein translocase subunit SecG
MFWVLVSINILIACAMTLSILMQASKGTGLTGTFGGSAVGTMFGVRRTSDFLQKFTIYLAGAFLLLCLVANLFFLPSNLGEARRSLLQDVPMPGSGQLPPGVGGGAQQSAPAAQQGQQPQGQP